MYSAQMLLPLGLRHITSHDFIHGAPNQEAWDFLCRYPYWPNVHTLIIGPKSCGKTLLAESLAHTHNIPLLNVASSNTASHGTHPIISDLPLSDLVIDNIDACDQTWLFHLINHQNLNQKRIIALTCYPLDQWTFEFLDLSSRLKTFYPIKIFDVNDALLFELLRSGLQKRGMAIRTDDQLNAITYLMRRIPRTYASIQHILEQLDRFLLEHHKAFTMIQATRFLDAYTQRFTDPETVIRSS